MDGVCRRVEWIGNFRRNSLMTRGMEIDVAFRRLTRIADRFVITDDIRIRVVGAEEICGLPIGSIWMNGSLIASSHFTVYRLPLRMPVHSVAAPCVWDIRSLARLSKGGGKEQMHEFGSCGVPRSLEAGSVYQGLTKYEKQLVPFFVPAFEVARAWYLRDSELTRRLLADPIDLAIRSIIDESKSSFSDGNCVLKLREGMSGSAVPVAAMLAFDNFARQSAKRMVSSYVAAYTRKTTHSIEALPPVSGKHVVQAHGEFLNTKFGIAFFAYSLSAVPFPKFQSIEWSRERTVTNPQDESNEPLDDDVEDTEGVVHPRRPAEVHVRPGDSRVGGSVNSLLQLQAKWIGAPEIKRTLGHTDRVYLTDARPKRPESNEVDRSPIVAVSGVGFDNKDGTPLHRFEIKDEGEEANKSHLLPADLESFDKVVSELSRSPELSVRSVTGRTFVDGPKNRRITLFELTQAWAYVNQKPREAMVVEIACTNRHFYLFEVGRRHDREEYSAGLVWRNDFQIFRTGDIDRILNCVAQARGMWSKVHEPYCVKSIPHKFVSESNFARWIERWVKSLIERGNLRGMLGRGD